MSTSRRRSRDHLLERTQERAALAAAWVGPVEPRASAWLRLPTAFGRECVSHESWRRYWTDTAAGIMVHINKTAGTSVSAALGQPAVKHMNAVMIRSLVGEEIWNQKFSFAIVRNPYERVISDYNYRLKNGFTGLGANPIGFEEWFDHAYVQKNPPYHFRSHMFGDQHSWISDEGGDVIVDYVGRFEELKIDWSEIARSVGLQPELEHRNSQTKSYRAQSLSLEVSGKIAQVFERDFELFGYSTDPDRSSEPPSHISGGLVTQQRLAS